MNVLMFSADYTPDSGGISGHVYRLSHALVKHGVHVTVVGGHVLPLEGREALSIDTKELREIRVRRIGPRGFRAAWFLLRARRLLRSLEGEHWDVLHYHNFFPDGLALRDFGAARVRLVTNHSSAFLRAYENGRKRRIYQFLAHDASGIIAPSDEIALKTRHYFPGPMPRIEYIPNGVDTELFTPGPGRVDVGRTLLGAQSAEDVVLLATRRHDPKCGLEYLLRAMPAILACEPRALLCLVGSGRETTRLKVLASELGCSGRVRFVGRVENGKLPAVYRAAYLSVLPSTYEAVSLSGLESLACGCPVVGSRVGGIPAFVMDRETGLLVEPKSPESLAAGICQLIRDPVTRDDMGLRGRRLVEQRFSWDCAARSTIRFYHECLEASGLRSGERVLRPGINRLEIRDSTTGRSQGAAKS